MTLLIVFEKLRYVLFRINTIYQKMVSDRPDTLNQSLADNLNFELYGSSGGFNPNTKVIKTCMGSAVDELRVASALNLSLPRAKIRFDSFVKDILDDNDGVIHQHTDNDRESQQGHDVQSEMEKSHSDEGTDELERHRQHHYESVPPVVKEDEDDQGHEYDGEKQVLDDGLD